MEGTPQADKLERQEDVKSNVGSEDASMKGSSTGKPQLKKPSLIPGSKSKLARSLKGKLAGTGEAVSSQEGTKEDALMSADEGGTKIGHIIGDGESSGGESVGSSRSGPTRKMSFESKLRKPGKLPLASPKSLTGEEGKGVKSLLSSGLQVISEQKKKATKQEIVKRNASKPKTNLARISKFLHIIIYQYLTVKEIFSVSAVSRSLHKASHDNGVWEVHFPNQRRLTEFKQDPDAPPVTKRELFIYDMKVISNLTKKKRCQNYNLDGHKDQLTALNIGHGLIVSGSRDKTVKVWDIERKKGWTFEGRHPNQINKVMMWDRFQAISASIDKSIRMFDIRDWGNPNQGFTEDSQTQNGYQYSKHFKGHQKGITHLQRINNSHSRFLSTSEDASIKIWDIFANQYCDSYNPSEFRETSKKENTEIITPLVSLEGGPLEHKSGIKQMKMNDRYLATYSLEDNTLIVRDWEKMKQPLIRLTNFTEFLHLNEMTRTHYNSTGFEIANMCLDHLNPNLLITSESKRIRIWDLRVSIQAARRERRAAMEINSEHSQVIKNLKPKSTSLKNTQDQVFKTTEMEFQSSQNRLIAHFNGAMGLHVFDLRRTTRTLDNEQYYNLHDYPISTFCVGSDSLVDYALSVGTTKEYRYDIRPIDLRKPKSAHDPDYAVFPGHKSVIRQLFIDGDRVISGGKKGEIKVMKFGLFRGELKNAPSCITLKN